MSVLFHGVDIWARRAPWHYQRPLKAAKNTSESHSRKVCAPLRPFCLGDEASERGKKTEADVWRRTSPHWKAEFWGSISNAPRCATPIANCALLGEKGNSSQRKRSERTAAGAGEPGLEVTQSWTPSEKQFGNTSVAFEEGDGSVVSTWGNTGSSFFYFFPTFFKLKLYNPDINHPGN